MPVRSFTATSSSCCGPVEFPGSGTLREQGSAGNSPARPDSAQPEVPVPDRGRGDGDADLVCGVTWQAQTGRHDVGEIAERVEQRSRVSPEQAAGVPQLTGSARFPRSTRRPPPRPNDTIWRSRSCSCRRPGLRCFSRSPPLAHRRREAGDPGAPVNPVGLRRMTDTGTFPHRSRSGSFMFRARCRGAGRGAGRVPVTARGARFPARRAGPGGP